MEPRAGTLQWKLKRYLFRPDVVRKVRSRYSGYRRRAERDAFNDVAEVYRMIGTPEVVLDVGANIGLVTSTLLRKFPKASVHAFEPTPETARTLRERLGAEPRLTFQEVAVSDVGGTTMFNVDNRTHAGGSNSLLTHSANFATRDRVDRYIQVEVRVTTLDSYATEHGITHVGLMKLDIEGAELRALVGAERLLNDQAIDFIVSEARFIADYEGQPLFCDLVSHMGSHGYSLFNLYTPAESGVRQALFTDVVFISDKMRKRLSATYGDRQCGWHPEETPTSGD